MNSNKLKIFTRFLALSALAFGLASCGGSSGSSAAAASQPVLSFDTKVFRFTWTDTTDATHYKLLENPDGISGFTQVGSDIAQGTQTVDHSVALYQRVNASYILQSCINTNCTNSSTIEVSGSLESAIGYLKASNTGGAFGGSVAISGDTVVVGAYKEDSSSTGVNSTPNEAGTNAGAVYIY